MKQLIWDIPTRFFHWAFALSILLAFGFGKFAPEHSAWFSLHMFFGALAGILLVWRLVWGIAGSKHVRFGALVFSPARVFEYFASVFKGQGQYFAGHNPGGALSVWIMFVLAFASVFTGLSMGFLGETFEEVHEVTTMLLIGVVIFHVTGVILATFMHGEGYIGAMFTGKKRGDAGDAISSAHPAAGFLLMLLMAVSGSYIWKGFDLKKASFTAPGTNYTITFGEGEEEGEEEEENENEEGEEDDDD